MQSKFPMGTWLFMDLDKFTKRDVEHWRDCGLTLTMSPNYNPEKHDIAKMLEIMDYCHECGIKLIVCDSRSRWIGASTDPEAYKAKFEEAYKDFGKHPATWGFYLGDEPGLNAADDVIKAYEIQLEVAPELVPYVNYFPFWHPSIEDIANSIFPRLTNMKNLCYDYYAQMRKVPVIDGYFMQLRRFKEIADEHNCPLWTTLLSSAHWSYEEPTKNDFIWQINSAVASGCEGLLWYRFYSEKNTVTTYRAAPINLFGERSEVYTRLSEAVREFHLYYGDYFARLKLQKSYHATKAFGGYPLFKQGDSDVVLKVEDLYSGQPAIVSFYKDENGDDYFAVMKNSKTDSARISITISSNAGKIVNVGNEKVVTPTEITTALLVGGGTDKADADSIPDSYDHIGWYGPGQMNLYKIEK